MGAKLASRTGPGPGKGEELYILMKYRKITAGSGRDYLNMNNPDPNMKILIV